MESGKACFEQGVPISPSSDIFGSDLLVQIHLGKLALTPSSLLALHLLLHSTPSLGNPRLKVYAPRVHLIPVVSVLSACVLPSCSRFFGQGSPYRSSVYSLFASHAMPWLRQCSTQALNMTIQPRAAYSGLFHLLFVPIIVALKYTDFLWKVNTSRC